MIEEPSLDTYLEALREDLPSAKEEARMQRRLLSAGIGVSLALASKTVAAQSTLAKTGLLASLSTRFLSLPLMAQLGVVTGTTTVVATGPVWAVMQRYDGRASKVERAAEAPRPSRPSSNEPQARALSARLLDDERQVTSAPTAILDVGATQILSRSEPKAPIATSPETSTLAEETRLLDAALAAIRVGHLDRAERLIADHDALFPEARLARERQRVKEKLAEARRRRGE